MNDEQIQTFKQMLLDLKASSEQRATSNQDALNTVTLDQNRVDRLSRMDALQGQQMAQEAERRRLLNIKQIEGALRRIELGDYGHSFICDEPIQLARLRFDSTITRSVSCSDNNNTGSHNG